jgi:hypothetical protein
MDKGIERSSGSPLLQDIAVDTDGKVYIGGYFDMRFSDEELVNHVAVWNGTEWTALGTGLGTSTTQGINAVFSDGKNIYFGGAFSVNGLQNQAIWNEDLDFTLPSNPGVYIFDYESNPVMSDSYQIRIHFSQAITGFTESDISITNATITYFEELSADQYFRITVSPISDGQITVTVPANSATNTDALPNVVSNTYKNIYFDGDENWFFDFDGIVEGEVYDIIHSDLDGKIYFCGGFLQVNGNTDMKCIARWNPRNNTWEQIPGIDYTHENFIRCMVQDDEGNIYVGGDFNTIAGIPAGRVAKFNVLEGTWESLKDENFFEESQMRGPETGGVYAIAYHNDYIYVGGWTFNSTDASLLYIRRFNTLSKTWENVGSGVDAKVSALCFDDSGNLYAGGDFTNYVAKFDGVNWTNLAEGVNGSINDLKFYNGDLYVGGFFTKVGNDIRSQGIAKWNGTSWEAMGEGIDNSSISPSVYGISISESGKVYIGGYFDLRFSDDLKINHVAVFENDDWSPLGYGLANSSTQGINTVYAYGNDVFFGGAFTRPIVNGILNQALWNENIDFTQDFAPAVSITTSETKITANTSFEVTIKFTEEVELFQKTDISVNNGGVISLTQEVDPRVYTAVISPLVDGKVEIFMLENNVKDFTNNYNLASDTLTIIYSSVLAELDKNWFFEFDGLINGEVYDICKSDIDGKIYFAGGFLSVDGNSNMKNFVRYVPSTNTWEQVPGITSSFSNFVRCIAQDANGNLFIGGDFSSVNSMSVGRVAKFDVANGTWSALEDVNFFETSQKKGPNSGGVYAITVSGDYVYIGGHTFNSSDAAYLYLRRFNTVANTWESAGTGVDAKVTSLTTDDLGNVYAGGIFTNAGGVAVNNIAKFDGTNWTALAEGTNSEVLDLEYSNGNLYVGGFFTKVGNDIRSQGIAEWNGTSWNAMGKGIDNSQISPSVYGIAVDTDNNVYIAGYFDLRFSDDAKVNHCAMFDGTDWIALGSGLGQTGTQGVNALYADGDNIYAGGAFAKPSGGTQNTAIWNKTIDFTPDVAPSVAIYSFDNEVTMSNPIEVIIEFSEEITGFDISQIEVTNGTAANLSEIITNQKIMFEITPTAEGEITVNYTANQVMDLNGNQNSAAIEFTITYDATIDIESNTKKIAVIYPNPSKDFITIVLPESDMYSDVKIINLQGSIIYQNRINSSEKINITNLSTGIYILEVNTGNSVYRNKFIKVD